MAETKVALVTGASRGIGKVIAHYLAQAGFDVAIGARTVHEGEAREHSSTVKQTNTKPLPGSLDSTGALVEKEGRRALPVYVDLLDRTSLGSAVAGIWSMAGLPCCKAMVWVGPPLLARPESSGSVFCRLPVAMNTQLLSLDRL